MLLAWRTSASPPTAWTACSCTCAARASCNAPPASSSAASPTAATPPPSPPLLAEHATAAARPAVTGWELGHGPDQRALPHGARVVLDADAGTLTAA